MSLYNANNICLRNVLKVSLIFNPLLTLSFYILIQYQYLFNCILGIHIAGANFSIAVVGTVQSGQSHRGQSQLERDLGQTS